MAQRGEILNKSALQKLARRLKMGAVAQFPSKLNLDEVLVVTPLLPPGVEYIDGNVSIGPTDISAAGAPIFEIIAPKGLPFTPGQQIATAASSVGVESRIFAFGIHITFAGAVPADDIGIQVNRVSSDGNLSPYFNRPNLMQTVPGTIDYLWCSGGSSNNFTGVEHQLVADLPQLWVPGGCGLNVIASLRSGAGMPALTSWTRWASIIQTPLGIVPPI